MHIQCVRCPHIAYMCTTNTCITTDVVRCSYIFHVYLFLVPFRYRLSSCNLHVRTIVERRGCEYESILITLVWYADHYRGRVCDHACTEQQVKSTALVRHSKIHVHICRRPHTHTQWRYFLGRYYFQCFVWTLCRIVYRQLCAVQAESPSGLCPAPDCRTPHPHRCGVRCGNFEAVRWIMVSWRARREFLESRGVRAT